MRPTIILLLLLGVLSPAYSKDKRVRNAVRANYYYAHYAYAYAIPHLEKLVASGNSSLDVYVKLGDSYRLTGDMAKAAKAYNRATSMKKCSNITYLNYAMVLMKLMKYDEAEKNLKKYQEKEKNNTDERVASLLSSCTSALARINYFPSGIVRPAPFNTDHDEFAPTIWNGKLVFTSNYVRNADKEWDKWKDAQYCGLYSIPLNGPGVYGDKVEAFFGPGKFKTEYHAGAGTFAADGHELYYTVTAYNRKFAARRASLVKDTAVLLKIMIASDYKEKREKFKKLRPFQYNSTQYSVAHPAVSPDGNVLVFVSDMPDGSGRRDLYLCKKEGSGWTEPVNAGSKINTGGDEEFPWWASNSTLFFSSDGHEGLGGLDIYRTTYSSGSFSTPEAMPMPINSSYDDISQAIAINLDSAYISSDRPGSMGGDNIFYYERREIFLQLNVKDSVTQLPIDGVTVVLKSARHKKDTVCGNGGMFVRLYPEAQYTVQVSKDGYPSAEFTVNTSSDKKIDTLFRKVSLKAPVQPHRDIIAPIITAEQVVFRNKNVMDPPGISDFNLNEVYEVGDFSYGYNQYELTKAHTKFLDTMVTQLNRHSTMVIEIHAHTDCRGSEASNVKLSTKRALSVVNYLEAQGIQHGRVQYKGLGSSMPKVKCPDCNSCTEEQHALNRIFEFKVLHL